MWARESNPPKNTTGGTDLACSCLLARAGPLSDGYSTGEHSKKAGDASEGLDLVSKGIPEDDKA